MAQLDPSSIVYSTSLVAYTCTLDSFQCFCSLSLSSLGYFVWLVSLAFLTSYQVYSGQDKVRIANSPLSSIAVISCIPPTSFVFLTFMFNVPNFKLNLMSVSHIIKDLNYRITFFPYYIFQDLETRNMLLEAMRIGATPYEWVLTCSIFNPVDNDSWYYSSLRELNHFNGIIGLITFLFPC